MPYWLQPFTWYIRLFISRPMKKPKLKGLKNFSLIDLIVNVYYLLYMYVWVILSVVASGIGLAILLFFLEWAFPEDIHVLNYSLTDKTFKELFTNHHYHAAIFIAENDTSYITKDHPDNRSMLSDCYVHVGEYSKAEKIGREFLDLNFEDLGIPKKEVELVPKELVELVNMSWHAMAARDLFRLYEKMGDRERQLEMYRKLKESCSDSRLQNIEQILGEMGLQLPTIDAENEEMFSTFHNFKYDIICGLYLENPEAAIDSLMKYTQEVWTLPRFNAAQKLSFINRMISWRLERNELIKAQVSLLNGISIIPEILQEDRLAPLGEFAEYCYLLHDYKNAKRFMKIYMRYIKKYYNEDDLEYLLAEARFIKYQGDDMDKRIKDLSHCCRGLREQISKNFAGMTSSQQEYFSKSLNEPFAYALQLLESNPDNERLIELCFENELFNRGLLMRSDALLRRALTESEDKSLLGDYDDYLLLKRELVARSNISGPGNMARRIYLQNQVSKLEKKLADGCAEFARSNYSLISTDDMKSSLSKDECLVTYAEIPGSTIDKGGLGAFVLSRKNGLRYVQLSSDEELASLGNMPILDLCLNTMSYKQLFAKLEYCIPEGSKVLYSPAGLIHRIPLTALSIDQDKILGEKYTLSIMANPYDLQGRESTNRLKLEDIKLAMWGGIDYGESSSEVIAMDSTRSVVRGKLLHFLPGSKYEVEDICQVLQGKVKSVSLFTGSEATERSFKSMASQADLLHISTHGFFKEDKEHAMSNAMHNSGLFFANSNRAWKDDYKPKYFQKDYEDGILRAEEIESQNLASCKLVVLSACETGLGELNGNEGVYGLQRAFKLAGARCILMSLWSVPDSATEELMKRFYENLIAENDIDNAFLNAQMSMKNSKNARYGVLDWGGFVLLH